MRLSLIPLGGLGLGLALGLGRDRGLGTSRARSGLAAALWPHQAETDASQPARPCELAEAGRGRPTRAWDGVGGASQGWRAEAWPGPRGDGCPQSCMGACEESVDLLLLEHVELAQLVRTGVRVRSGTRSGCSAARQLAWQGTCRPMLKPMQLKALAVATSSLHTACERDRSSGRRTASSEMCRPGVRRVASSAMPRASRTSRGC